MTRNQLCIYKQFGSFFVLFGHHGFVAFVKIGSQGMANAVFCKVRSGAEATLVLTHLKSAGFSSRDISVLGPHQDIARDCLRSSLGDNSTSVVHFSVGGLFVGGVFGLLAGIGYLPIPIFSLVSVGGHTISPITIIIMGCATFSIAGAIIGVSLNEYQKRKSCGDIERGRCLVAVQTEDWFRTEMVIQIFEDLGGEEIVTSRVNRPIRHHQSSTATNGF